LLVIFSVIGILVFLAKEALPLFGGGTVYGQSSYSLPAKQAMLWTNTDEYQTIAIRISAEGAVTSFHVDSGMPLASMDLDFGGDVATSVGATLDRANLAFGFADGAVRFAKVAFETTILPEDELPGGLTLLNDGDMTDGTVVYRRIPGKQIRRIAVESGVQPAIQVADEGVAIKAIAFAVGGTTERPTQSYVTFDALGVGRLSRAETRINLMTRAATMTTRTSTLPELPQGTPIRSVLLSSQADQVYVGVTDGTVVRYDTRDFDQPALIETVRVTPEGVGLGVLGFLIGNQTIVAGGDDGSLRMYFRLQPEDAETADGYKLVLARELEQQPAGIVAMDVSQRRKSLITADSAGNVWFRHATSEQTLMKFKRTGIDPDTGFQVLLAPRDDGTLALSSDGAVSLWKFYVPHPESTLTSIFGEVWYEGYEGPGYTWQSSSGTDGFEP
jgi:phosphate transport system permease protein